MRRLDGSSRGSPAGCYRRSSRCTVNRVAGPILVNTGVVKPKPCWRTGAPDIQQRVNPLWSVRRLWQDRLDRQTPVHCLGSRLRSAPCPNQSLAEERETGCASGHAETTPPGCYRIRVLPGGLCPMMVPRRCSEVTGFLLWALEKLLPMEAHRP